MDVAISFEFELVISYVLCYPEFYEPSYFFGTFACDIGEAKELVTLICLFVSKRQLRIK